MKKIAIRMLQAAAFAAAALGMHGAHAQEKAIRIGLAQDFTAVYTFVTSDYSQGQRDYYTLVNERGGIKGHKLQVDVVDHANQPQRGIEAYERMKAEGAVLVDFLSTPVSRALVPRVLKDQVVMMTIMHGRSDAADGETFPYVFPMAPLYWSQAASILKYIADQEKGSLKGKKIAFVGIDSPFGRDPHPVIQALAQKEGFELSLFSYPSPGNEQSATWISVRRFKPDWTVVWGAGAGNTVSLREAIRNGIRPDRLVASAWLSEVDAEGAGSQAARGVLRFEGAAYGKNLPLIKAIEAEVVAKGKGSGPASRVGSSYYNIGVAGAALVVEGIRLALEKGHVPLTGAGLKAGLESISNFDAQGLMPPVTITAKDHQGGGRGRISQWDGTKWVPKTGWYAASQDVVWDLVRKNAEEFRKSGN